MKGRYGSKGKDRFKEHRDREKGRGQHRLGEATCIYKGDFTFLGIFSVPCLMEF